MPAIVWEYEGSEDWFGSEFFNGEQRAFEDDVVIDDMFGRGKIKKKDE